MANPKVLTGNNGKLVLLLISTSRFTFRHSNLQEITKATPFLIWKTPVVVSIYRTILLAISQCSTVLCFAGCQAATVWIILTTKHALSIVWCVACSLQRLNGLAETCGLA